MTIKTFLTLNECDITYNGITHNDFPNNGITYNDINYNDITVDLYGLTGYHNEEVCSINSFLSVSLPCLAK